MKEVVIEIDGVRHQLIEENTDYSDSCCDKCSLYDICNNIEGICLCIDGFEGSQNSLFRIVETKKDNSFENYTNFGNEYY